jgi:hypothetical protein
MIKGQQKNEMPPKRNPIKRGLSFIEAMKAGYIVPDRLTTELVLSKKIELKKVSGSILEFKYLRINETDDAGKFCVWLELDDIKNPEKKFKPIRLVPYVAPFASNNQIAYFTQPGNAVIINVAQSQKVYLTFMLVQKNYKTCIKSCTVTYIKSAL